MSSVVLAVRRAPEGKGYRPCPPYLCQISRMTADPSMPASGRLPRVGSATLAGQLFGGARTWRPVIALFDRVHDAGRLITFTDYRISQLQQELDTLKSGGGPEVVAKAEEHASELGQELEKTKRE
ncbi:hypothetical protein B296_00029276 [Ensete ventricosum]|uniref:Uncharacterized protein n=1 Tax=Ensete ventricosum TaxID=4639 RepID=A0A426ZIC2_ENSVE|nr:hypothetical protein B296_00029276 [Ensete ventricosum]